MVFNRGILKGSNGLIPEGGHFIPISIVGDNLEWKKAQKKEIKKNTSDIIKKIIPHFNPSVTLYVWNPWKVLSREISRHHWYIIIREINIPINKRLLIFRWKSFVVPVNVIIALNALKIGQGL